MNVLICLVGKLIAPALQFKERLQYIPAYYESILAIEQFLDNLARLLFPPERIARPPSAQYLAGSLPDSATSWSASEVESYLAVLYAAHRYGGGDIERFLLGNLFELKSMQAILNRLSPRGLIHFSYLYAVRFFPNHLVLEPIIYICSVAVFS